MAFGEKAPPPPGPDVPVTDPRTGLMSPPWYQWLARFLAYLERLRAAIP